MDMNILLLIVVQELREIGGPRTIERESREVRNDVIALLVPTSTSSTR